MGPILALTLVTAFGIKGTLGLVLPGALIGVVLLLNRSMLNAPVKSAFEESKKAVKAPLSKYQKRTFFLLISIATMRSMTQLGLATYIPFYYINYLKGEPLYAGKLVSTFLLAGALGTLIGGPLADRWGHKKYLLFSSIVSSLSFFYSIIARSNDVHSPGNFRNGLNLFFCSYDGHGSGHSSSTSGHGLRNDGGFHP